MEGTRKLWDMYSGTRTEASWPNKKQMGGSAKKVCLILSALLVPDREKKTTKEFPDFWCLFFFMAGMQEYRNFSDMDPREGLTLRKGFLVRV